MEIRITQVRAILNRLADGHREPRHSGKARFWNLSRDEFVNGPIYQKKPIDPGKPQESFLVKILKGPVDGFAQMPAGGPYISAGDLTFIEQWIADGAPDMDAEAVKALAS
ncbi:hypothetical protein CQ12_29010 [Bradyrhizobium jicamae]|uniref:Uncharacterized protein n=1 Tax=Bradyrhizobium jicamae TaxID=280332 RepID=A0A0R3M7G1_9BRAD|nr:hypothetical protein [Bradyrhizobium jicamae]KRR15992.1 hypothetical protein CQ12_29010 [Bradyrhizobium jicamae]